MFKRKMQTVSRIHILQYLVFMQSLPQKKVHIKKKYLLYFKMLQVEKHKKKLQKFMRINYTKTTGGFWNQGYYVEIVAIEKNQKLDT